MKGLRSVSLCAKVAVPACTHPTNCALSTIVPHQSISTHRESNTKLKHHTLHIKVRRLFGFVLPLIYIISRALSILYTRVQLENTHPTQPARSIWPLPRKSLLLHQLGFPENLLTTMRGSGQRLCASFKALNKFYN